MVISEVETNVCTYCFISNAQTTSKMGNCWCSGSESEMSRVLTDFKIFFFVIKIFFCGCATINSVFLFFKSLDSNIRTLLIRIMWLKNWNIIFFKISVEIRQLFSKSYFLETKLSTWSSKIFSSTSHCDIEKLYWIGMKTLLAQDSHVSLAAPSVMIRTSSAQTLSG